MPEKARMEEQKAMVRSRSMRPWFNQKHLKKLNCNTLIENHKRPGKETMKLLISIVLWFNMTVQ
jgi:hypothetical protein